MELSFVFNPAGTVAVRLETRFKCQSSLGGLGSAGTCNWKRHLLPKFCVQPGTHSGPDSEADARADYRANGITNTAASSTADPGFADLQCNYRGRSCAILQSD